MQYENYDPCFPDQPVVDLYLPIWANLKSFKTKPAFIWAEDDSTGVCKRSSLTYGQLNNSVQSISSLLISSLALQRRDTVVVLCFPGLVLAEIIFACQRAGLLAVPIIPPNPSFDKDDHHHLVRALSQTKPRAAIAHSSYIKRVRQYLSSSGPSNKRLREHLQNLTWISTEELIREEKKVELGRSNSFSYNGCKPDEVYLIQYTSGATAIPKPILVKAGSAAHNVRAARKAYDLHPNSVIVSWLPQYHDCGLMFLLLTIVSGATCVLTSPTAFINRPRLWLELITEYKATCTPVPSFTLPLVVKRGEIKRGSSPINMSTMKNLILINEPICNSIVEEFVNFFRPFGLNRGAISPSYGLAENCTFVSTAWRRDNNLSSLPVYKKLLPSGRLGFNGENATEVDEFDILIVNEETHESVEDGVEGEIWISSPSNASGYLGHPSLTRKIFNGRLRNRLGTSFLRTGDRGIVIGEERFLFVTGRCSDIIKLFNNQELHPHYVESSAYASSPRFLRGGCLAAFKVSEALVVVAEMQKGETKANSLQKLCEDIRKSILREDNVEVGMVVLVKGGDIPKTTSGKIQRWAAKHKLISGKMNVIMKMKFDNHLNSLALINIVMNASEGGNGGDNVREGNISFSIPPNNHSLQSSL